MLARLDAKLGRCPRCFRLALAGALVGWACFALLIQLDPAPGAVVAALMWAAAFTGLWLTHLGVYARRSLIDATGHGPAVDGRGRSPLTRRQAVALLARSFRYAILVSASGILIAASKCDPDPEPTRRQDQPQPIQCPCRSPKNVYNASFWLNGKFYPAGCYDRCYSTDCRTYRSC